MVTWTYWRKLANLKPNYGAKVLIPYLQWTQHDVISSHIKSVQIECDPEYNNVIDWLSDESPIDLIPVEHQGPRTRPWVRPADPLQNVYIKNSNANVAISSSGARRFTRMLHIICSIINILVAGNLRYWTINDCIDLISVQGTCYCYLFVWNRAADLLGKQYWQVYRLGYAIYSTAVSFCSFESRTQ